MGRIMLATGLVVAYGYMMETFMAWYSGNTYEQFMMLNRFFGPYAPHVLGADPLQRARAAAALVPEGAHAAPALLLLVAMFVNVGMWLERYIIIVVSLHRDFLPSSWGMYYRHDLGLGHVPRHDRALPHAASSCSSASCR